MLCRSADCHTAADFARDRSTGSNIEDALDGVEVRRVAAQKRQQPSPNRADRKGTRGSSESTCIGRIQRRSELFEQVLVLPQRCGRPSDQQWDVTLGNVVGERQQFMAHAVTPEVT